MVDVDQGDGRSLPDDLSLRALLNSAPDGIILVDSQGRVAWANRTLETMFGYEPGELSRRSVDELVPDRLRAAHFAHRSGFQANPRVRPMGFGLDLLARKKDGSEFPVEISLSPLQGSDRLLVTAVVRDVRERKRLEEERSLLETQLETERERDRIAMDLHDGILQDIYASALTLELAVAQGDSPGSADAACVERAIDQLHEVVRDIRSYIFDLRPREFSGNLSSALSDLAREFSQNSQIETRVDVDGDFALEMTTAVALYHIAHEALSNVQKHARAKRVTIALQFGEGSGALYVRDDGIGYDVSAEQAEEHRGMRNMVSRAHSIEAALRVTSAPGKGTRLSVEFPLTAP